MLRIAFFSLFSLVLAAQAPQVDPQGNAKKQTESEKPIEDKVIGRIGNNIYRESDFLDFLPLQVQQQPALLEQVKRMPAMKKQYEKSFLETMLLANKAKKDGLDKTSEFNNRLTLITKAMMAQEAVGKFSESQKPPVPTEEQVKGYYEENKNNFKAKDTASARHILVAVRKNEKETDKLTDEEAQVKIAKAKAELVGGKKWEVVAKNYSDDPGSKENGGLYENFNPVQMVKEFADAVRTQEIGKIGDPVKTQFGYHIILVENRNIDQIQTFDEAQETAQKELTDKMRNDIWRSFIDSLKTELGYADDEASIATPIPAPTTPKAATTKKPATAKPSGGKK
ncbi:MAG: peptidylprolyl isomerase [Holophagales bacterium]|jgi:parvulin-like peptidyl-prolyl isomerase|nr:peptidylprolyl isomerase [Holophagales bacterium]